jgi:hypothetical protein
VLTRRREGRRLFYRAQPEALGPVAMMLEAFWNSALSELKSRAEAEQRTKPRRKSPQPAPPRPVRTAQPSAKTRSARRTRQRKKGAD